MTRVGLIARCDDRGLGHMTWEFHRHVRPERTLVVTMGSLARGFAQRPERYPDGEVVAFRGGQLPEDRVREWLRGLDVVYSAETFYDWSLPRWAEEEGVATVLHAMPEFHGPHIPAVTETWAPTAWRIENLPSARLVPVPVALDRFSPDSDPPVRFLHVAGHRAMHDRNGTTTLLQALRFLRCPTTIAITCQDGRLPTIAAPPHVRVFRRLRAPADYWRLYDDAEVLVLPRRYGGLCLPAQEAMAAGLGVVMTDVVPNREWPIVPVPARQQGTVRCAAGELPMVVADPRALADAMDMLADADLRGEVREAGRRWAEACSWDVWAPRYRALLSGAAAR